MIPAVVAAPFWLQTLRHPSQVGALFECSAAVGQELVYFLKNHKGPRRVLELGAGKGAITKVITQYLDPSCDTLDVVEIDPEYCVDLYKMFPKERHPHISIYCIDVNDFEVSQPYDFIICTIPLTILDVGMLARLQTRIKSMAKSGTYFSYVAYKYLFSMRKFFTHGASRATIERRQKQIDLFKNQYHVRTASVFKNIPPIDIFHLRF